MKTRWVAAFLALGFLVFAGAFIWTAIRPPADEQQAAAGAGATATLSEVLSDGRIEAQVFALGGSAVQLDIRFTPNADALEAAGMRPSVNFAMVDMHMDGIDPPLQLVEAGAWRARFKLPMAGRWVVNIGMGEDFAEVEFDAE